MVRRRGRALLALKNPAPPPNSPGEHCSPLHPLPIGTVWRGLVPSKEPCVITNLWFTVGADSISARATLCNHPIARRGQDPSLRTDVNIIQRPKPQPRKIPGASGTPPPTNQRMWAVGANSVRPLNLVLPQNTTGGYRIRPYANQKFGPGGVNLFPLRGS